MQNLRPKVGIKGQQKILRTGKSCRWVHFPCWLKQKFYENQPIMVINIHPIIYTNLLRSLPRDSHKSLWACTQQNTKISYFSLYDNEQQNNRYALMALNIMASRRGPGGLKAAWRYLLLWALLGSSKAVGGTLRFSGKPSSSTTPMSGFPSSFDTLPAAEEIRGMPMVRPRRN